MEEKIKLKYLEKFEKRSQNLGNLIYLVNGSFLTVFLAFFAITVNSHYDFKILFAWISILAFWRIYIHFIDSEIIDIYRRIVCCELNIKDGIYEKISLQFNLKKSRSWANRGQLYFDIFALLIMTAVVFDFFLPLRKNHFGLHHDSCFLLIAVLEIFLYCCYFVCRKIKDDKSIDDIIKMRKEDCY